MTEQRTIAQKLLKIQTTIGAITKRSSNPHFRSKYADLNEVLDVAKEALNAEGIFISQSPGANEYGKFLATSLIDADSGQQVSGQVYFSGSEENMQKIGAATTYARRIGLVSLLALGSEDDDGETAVGRGYAKSTETRTATVVGADKPTVRPADAPATVEKEVRPGLTRQKINEKISLTSKVLVDSKRATQEEVVAYLEAFKVKTKEELNDEQAKTLLTQLEGRLK